MPTETDQTSIQTQQIVKQGELNPTTSTTEKKSIVSKIIAGYFFLVAGFNLFNISNLWYHLITNQVSIEGNQYSAASSILVICIPITILLQIYAGLKLLSCSKKSWYISLIVSITTGLITVILSTLSNIELISVSATLFGPKYAPSNNISSYIISVSTTLIIISLVPLALIVFRKRFNLVDKNFNIHTKIILISIFLIILVPNIFIGVKGLVSYFDNMKQVQENISAFGYKPAKNAIQSMGFHVYLPKYLPQDYFQRDQVTVDIPGYLEKYRTAIVNSIQINYGLPINKNQITTTGSIILIETKFKNNFNLDDYLNTRKNIYKVDFEKINSKVSINGNIYVFRTIPSSKGISSTEAVFLTQDAILVQVTNISYTLPKEEIIKIVESLE